jgi:hypothetical protein
LELIIATFKTWEEMSDLEQAKQIWWDAFKDAHGYRPHDIDTSEWKLEYVNGEIQKLGKIIGRQETERIVQQAAAVVEFECRVQKTMHDGAADRAAAIAVIHTEEGSHGDGDYLCYLVGIPYGYVNKDAVEQ